MDKHLNNIKYLIDENIVMRKFFELFQNVATVWQQLSWSHLKLFLPIKEEGKRNYYINLTIKNMLSVRELKKTIKDKSFERLTKCK